MREGGREKEDGKGGEKCKEVGRGEGEKIQVAYMYDVSTV